MPKLTIDELNELFTSGEECDKEVFAEQRSNILLVVGDHYAKKNSKYWNRIKNNQDLSSEQKLRLTKNHIQKITKTYVNNLVAHNPNVHVGPNNEKELQDQKAAELNASVWRYGMKRYDLESKIQQWAKDFIDIGECFVKVYWNPNKGDLLGDIPEMDEMGQPKLGEDGQPLIKGHLFSGDFEFERIYGFNLIRDGNAKDFSESKFVCARKMVDKKMLEKLVGDDEDKRKLITEDQDNTFLVFEGSGGGYGRSSKNQTMLREFYFRPCSEYPDGYYYICTQTGVLAEGILPFGLFPIVSVGFDEVPTSPRHRSIVKQLRPYQAEINRAASKIAEHQVTLGDDKLLVQSGTKITNGGTLPGVRTLQYSGLVPTILQGRSGEQYASYMAGQIQEMYQVANVLEDTVENEQTKADPYGALFASLKNKKKFQIYSNKFERFLVELCELYLELAKQYFDEERLVPAIGRSEYINISEFKNTEKLQYQITVRPMVNDLETMMGKQLMINHTLQYNSGQLQRQDIGKLVRNSPFGNLDEIFEDFTMDYDVATNLILALDRGEMPGINKYDDGPYIIKRLTNRIRQSDFSLLDPQIQQNYDDYVAAYEQIEADKQRQLLAAQAEYIPTGGALVKVDYYVSTGDGKVQRATVPAQAVDWLIQRLADQGNSMEQLAQLPTGAQSEISGQVVGGSTGQDLSGAMEGSAMMNQQAQGLQGRGY
jgi:hypothetical protein